MSGQIAEPEQKVEVALPTPLVKKIADMIHISPVDARFADYVANILREAIASRESSHFDRVDDAESEEIRARLKKIGYL